MHIICVCVYIFPCMWVNLVVPFLYNHQEWKCCGAYFISLAHFLNLTFFIIMKDKFIKKLNTEPQTIFPCSQVENTYDIMVIISCLLFFSCNGFVLVNTLVLWFEVRTPEEKQFNMFLVDVKRKNYGFLVTASCVFIISYRHLAQDLRIRYRLWDVFIVINLHSNKSNILSFKNVYIALYLQH